MKQEKKTLLTVDIKASDLPEVKEALKNVKEKTILKAKKVEEWEKGIHILTDKDEDLYIHWDIIDQIAEVSEDHYREESIRIISMFNNARINGTH